jgi:hypothetical protein
LKSSSKPSTNGSMLSTKRRRCVLESWYALKFLLFYAILSAMEHSEYWLLTKYIRYQIDQNSTLPCAISSVQVLNATHTRRGFLQSIFDPLLSVNKSRPYTLSEALREISSRADKLAKFGLLL